MKQRRMAPVVMIPDLCGALLVEPTEITAVPGALADGVPWDFALETVDRWAADTVALSRRPSGARLSAGFQVSVDGTGRSAVAVADQPSAARLARVLSSCSERDSFGEVAKSVQTLSQEPAVADRAVMECFYGPGWSAMDRRDVINRVASHGATTYVYGPAADLRTGARWREPYSAEGGTELATLVQDAHLRGMEVVWRVSPGAPLDRTKAMALSDVDELETLLKRIDEVVDLGCDRVLVAFDDIDSNLDPATQSTFAHDLHPMAAAHARVLNAVARRLAERGVRMLACPTHYWGVRGSTYRHRLGDLLDAGVDVCWTGSAVTSAIIRADQVQRVTEQFQHRLWLWDNFPVNDWDGIGRAFVNEMAPRRLPLAALHGREPEVATLVAGYGSNAALQPRAGLPAVCTALDWAWAPRQYRPERSLAVAFDETGLDRWALNALADASGPVAAGSRGPGALAAACAELIASEGSGRGRKARIEHAREVVAHHEAAALALGRSAGALSKEIGPWVDELARACRGAMLALDVLGAYEEDQDTVDDRAIQLRGMIRPGGRVSVAAGVLDSLVDYARGLAAGGAPTWPG